MPFFRKKPVVIEAVLFDGCNHSQIFDFTQKQSRPPCCTEATLGLPITIPTLEGDHKADVGDVIIKGVKGEFYPCKPDIFAATYEAVEADQQ